eukprot:9176238-Pyramimonas_sp.AAC.1
MFHRRPRRPKGLPTSAPHGPRGPQKGSKTASRERRAAQESLQNSPGESPVGPREPLPTWSERTP